MSDDGSATILLRDVPGDVVRELEARARANYRSRYGELMAILVAVCRGHIVFPAACAVGTGQGRGEGEAGLSRNENRQCERNDRHERECQ